MVPLLRLHSEHVDQFVDGPCMWQVRPLDLPKKSKKKKNAAEEERAAAAALASAQAAAAASATVQASSAFHSADFLHAYRCISTQFTSHRGRWAGTSFVNA